jgi:hypothetical protein
MPAFTAAALPFAGFTSPGPIWRWLVHNIILADYFE